MPEEIFAAAGSALGARAAERHVLAIQDTLHLSFPRRAGEVIAPPNIIQSHTDGINSKP